MSTNLISPCYDFSLRRNLLLSRNQKVDRPVYLNNVVYKQKYCIKI